MPAELLLPARTYLFVPGTRPERFGKALASGADRVVLDLEDAVAADDKANARSAIATWMQGATPADRSRIVVRINDAGSPWFAADLAALARRACDCRAPAQGRVGSAGRRDPGCVAGREHPRAHRKRTRRVRGGPHRGRRRASAWCSARSTSRSTSTWTSPRTPAGLGYAASRIAIASRLAGLPAPVAGVTPQLDDEERLLSDLARGATVRLRRQAVHSPTPGAADPHRAASERAGTGLGAARPRCRCRIARRGPARRSHGRPARRAAGTTHAGPCPQLTPFPNFHRRRDKHHGLHHHRLAHLRRHVQRRAHARRLVRREPHRQVPGHRARPGEGPG